MKFCFEPPRTLRIADSSLRWWILDVGHGWVLFDRSIQNSGGFITIVPLSSKSLSVNALRVSLDSTRNPSRWASITIPDGPNQSEKLEKFLLDFFLNSD